MSSTKNLAGAKGGGHVPYEASDTLRSTQRGEIVDVLGEGQIGGLVNGLKSVYLDGVPVENADGSRNFDAFGFTFHDGGPTGDMPPHGFGDVQTEVGVGVTVTQAVPVVRTIADAAVDAVRVTIQVPQLVHSQDNGDRVGASFEWAIDVQSAGGGFVLAYTDTVSGKASSTYSRAAKLDLASLGPAPWDIRVRRITADSASSSLVNAFGWASYTAISGVRMLYRNSAKAWLTFDAQHFSAIPARAYDVLGINDWDIPVNYDPLARTLAGTWDGTWKQGWTNNPAWVLYNLVQHPRYGLGEYVTELPDKWQLYQLAQWCDGLVPDGKGGMEPRYMVNAYIQAQVEAVRLLQDICSIFRGVLLHGAGTLGTSWDAPGEPVMVYGPANVVDGMFTYADGSRAAKKSACTCWYNDRSQFGKRVQATWDDPALVAKYGLRRMEIDPIGVATASQALRMAKWALYTTEHEDGTVAFQTGASGQTARLGEVFGVADPAETGERLAGRVSAATTVQVTLDAPVTLLVGETYTLWVTLQDPGDATRLMVESRTVTTAAGERSVLEVATPFSVAPMRETMWLLEGSNVRPTLWRYISLREVKGENGALLYEVTGLRHDPGKWDLIENNQPLTPRPTRRLTDAAPQPAPPTLTEDAYIQDGAPRIRATASWPYPAAGLRYLVAWRLSQGPWTTLAPTSANTVDIEGLVPGLLEVSVRARNGLGNVSPPATAQLVLTGKVGVLGIVTGLGYENVVGGMRVHWGASAEATYLEHELRLGATWAAGSLVWKGAGTSHTWVPAADGPYTLWLVQRDRSGNESVPEELVAEYVSAGGADGASVYTATVYKQVGSPPSAPTGGSFNFTSSVLTAPTGWSVTQPATTTTPTYACEFTFATDTPGATVGGGTWSAPYVDAVAGTPGATGAAGSTGATGAAGAAGTQAATVALFQWAVGTPGGATGTTTYTWASGTQSSYTGGNGWVIGVPANPGTPGAKLWQVLQGVTAAGGTSSSAVAWPGGSTPIAVSTNGDTGPTGSTGAAGANGLQVATATVFQWAITVPTGPVGAATFNWGTLSFGSAPGAWALTPGTSVSPGFTLWAAVVNVVDAATATTTGFNWVSASISARGAAGDTGAAGGTGATGATGLTGNSYRQAYAKITGQSLSPTPTTYTTSGSTSFPPTNTWGGSETWGATVPTYGAGESIQTIDAIYSASTGNTVWGAPYLVALKVGQLSAISANLGSITAGQINFGSYTGWAWPPFGTYGAHFSANGLLLGNYLNGAWLEINHLGNIYAPQFSIVDGVATFGGALNAASGNFVGSMSVGGATWANGVNGFWAGLDAGVAKWRAGNNTQYIRWTGSALEQKLDTFSASASPSSVTGSVGNGYAYYGGCTVTPSGGVGGYTYAWTLSVYTGAVAIQSGANTASAAFGGIGNNETTFADARCQVTDSNGRTTTVVVTVSFVHGTP